MKTKKYYFGEYLRFEDDFFLKTFRCSNSKVKLGLGFLTLGVLVGFLDYISISIYDSNNLIFYLFSFIGFCILIK